MRSYISRNMLAGLAAAGALAGGMLMMPPATSAQSDLRLHTQDPDKKPATITITGTALKPDGTPGANLPVTIKAVAKKPVGPDGGGGEQPPELLSQGKDASKSKDGMMKVLAQGTTDANGKFSLKLEPLGQGDQTVTLEIGQTTKTHWAKQQVVTRGKDVDVGNVQLREPARGSNASGS